MAEQRTQQIQSNAEGNAASRMRSYGRIRQRDDDDEADKLQPAQSSTHVSPAMRIYRRALESIFAMLQLEDLSRALAVSRAWAAAVRSMKPIGAAVERDSWLLWQRFRPLPPVHHLAASPLTRHLGTIHIRDLDRNGTQLINLSLALLAQCAPNLTSLWCVLTLTPGAPLILPPNLTSLELRLSGQHTAATVDGVLTTLAALRSLQQLVFRVNNAVGVNFSVLAASSSLRELTLQDRHAHWRLVLSNEQVKQLRTSLGHLQRISVADMTSDELVRFLQPPVTARWQDIGHVLGDARTSDLLAALPTLTKLHLLYFQDAPHAHFLSQLPLLKSLMIACQHVICAPDDPHPFRIPAESMLASLLHCNGLTELYLHCGINTAQLGTLLAKLSQLKQLTFRGELESLQCFSSGPITRTLEELTLHGRFPLSELAHLYALRRLHSLTFQQAFESLDASTLASLSPPTPTFPLLTRFLQSWAPPYTNLAVELERTGLSFEWMQKRLTQ